MPSTRTSNPFGAEKASITSLTLSGTGSLVTEHRCHWPSVLTRKPLPKRHFPLLADIRKPQVPPSATLTHAESV